MKHSLFWRLFIPVLGVIIVSLAVISWYVPNAIRNNAELEAIENAKRSVNQFKTIRKYYTENVIQKVIGRDGLKASINHENDKVSIPLPATMIINVYDEETGDLTGTEEITNPQIAQDVEERTFSENVISSSGKEITDIVESRSTESR